MRMRLARIIAQIISIPSSWESILQSAGIADCKQLYHVVPHLMQSNLPALYWISLLIMIH
jgi:hypothetical protein